MVTRAKKVKVETPAVPAEANVGGRPEIEINYKTVEECGAQFRTHLGAAAILDISLSTFKRRMADDPLFKEAWERGLGRAHNRLRDLQWSAASQRGERKLAAAVTAQIHIGKHLLGETDKTTIEHANKDGEAFKIATEKPTEFMGVSLANATEEELAALELISAARDRQIALAAQSSGEPQGG